MSPPKVAPALLQIVVSLWEQAVQLMQTAAKNRIREHACAKGDANIVTHRSAAQQAEKASKAAARSAEKVLLNSSREVQKKKK